MIVFGQLTFKELEKWLLLEGFKAQHARKIWQDFYQAERAGQSNKQDLPIRLIHRLEESFDYSPSLKTDQIQKSADGTQKFLFKTGDNLSVEAVFIPQGKRKTICLSSQIGCPWSCRFCATGAMGFRRNMSVSEMVSQVTLVQGHVQEKASNLVFMGMGEPLSNFENLRSSHSILTHPLGLAFPPRRVTISTIGLLDGIQKMIDQNWTSPLAVSLHHHDGLKRSELMPGTLMHGLDELMGLLKRYTMKLNRPVFFEYLLLKNINDSLEDAAALVELIRSIPCRLNLIHFHPFGEAAFQPSDSEQADAFYRYIQKAGIQVIFRKSRGEDIRAACGQLAGGNA